MTTLEDLVRELALDHVPQSWSTHWPAFSAWRRAGGCGELHWTMPGDAVRTFDLPAEALPALEEMYARVAASPPLGELACFWHWALYHLQGEIGDEPGVWPRPAELPEESRRLFALAMMVSGCAHARANFQATRVRQDIALATLGYIGRYARDVKQRRGVWGLESISWLRNYVRANIYRLGRLTFRASPYQWTYRVYRRRHSADVITLCEPSLRFRTDGCADGTNGIEDPEAWTTLLDVRDDTVTGHRATNDCRALREPVTLDANQWELVLAPGDQRVEVHIAGGSKMPMDECLDAYRLALDFFPRHYPGTRFAAFTCFSWLLDPALPRILPAESNIVRFQLMWHLLPTTGDHRQAYDLVFGDPNIDPCKAPPATALQKAIAGHVAAGNRMRSAGGFLLWDEAAAMARKARRSAT